VGHTGAEGDVSSAHHFLPIHRHRAHFYLPRSRTLEYRECLHHQSSSFAPYAETETDLGGGRVELAGIGLSKCDFSIMVPIHCKVSESFQRSDNLHRLTETAECVAYDGCLDQTGRHKRVDGVHLMLIRGRLKRGQPPDLVRKTGTNAETQSHDAVGWTRQEARRLRNRSQLPQSPFRRKDIYLCGHAEGVIDELEAGNRHCI